MLCCTKHWIHRSGVLHRSKWVPGRPADKSMEAVKLPTTHSYNPWCQQYKCMFNQNIFGLFMSSDMQNSDFVLLRYFETRSWHCDGLLIRYVKLQVAHVPGMPRTFSPPPTSKKTTSQRSGMHHGKRVTHVRMSGSLTRGGVENVSGMPGAYAIRNFTYLARSPCCGIGLWKIWLCRWVWRLTLALCMTCLMMIIWWIIDSLKAVTNLANSVFVVAEIQWKSHSYWSISWICDGN